MSKLVYQSASSNNVIFQDIGDIDHTLRVESNRSWVDSAKNIRFLRLNFKEFRNTWLKKPNCDDACLSVKSTETFSVAINVPVISDAKERAALLARWDLFAADVRLLLDTHHVIDGSLPPINVELRNT